MEVGGYKGEIFFNGIFQMIIGGKKGELFPFVIIKYMHFVCIYIYLCTCTSLLFGLNIQPLPRFN